MGLFSRRKREPVVHPERMRRIHVAADRQTVVARLDEYERRSGAGNPTEIRLASSGDWTTVVVPGRVHPWAFHDLTLWLVDVADTGCVAVADVGEGGVGYWLVEDEQDSWLSGYDERGEPLSVSVPDNGLVVGDDVAHEPATSTQALVDRGVPTDLHYADGDETRTLVLDDPGQDLNPGFEATHPSRRELREAGRHP